MNTQSQSGATKLTADKAIEVASTTGMVRIAAPSHILLTAAGAAIDIQPGSITLKGPGMIEFRAGMKVLTGPGSASASLELKKPGVFERFNEAFIVKNEETGEIMSHVRYRIEDQQGTLLAQGITDASGKTLRVHTSKAEQVKLFILDN